MIEIDNISFKKYLELEDRSEYDYYIRYFEPFKDKEDILSIGDFDKLQFGTVKDIQTDLSKQSITWEQVINTIVLLSSKQLKQIINLPILEICRQWNYIFSEVERITKIEKEALSHEPSADEVKAGIDKFNLLGAYMQLYAVASSFNIDPIKVRGYPYEICFLELFRQKTQAEYEKNYSKIISKLK